MVVLVPLELLEEVLPAVVLVQPEVLALQVLLEPAEVQLVVVLVQLGLLVELDRPQAVVVGVAVAELALLKNPLLLAAHRPHPGDPRHSLRLALELLGRLLLGFRFDRSLQFSLLTKCL